MARQSQIQFSIPEPCTVPWNGMTAVDKNQRYCSSCEKVITDFSKMSDDELMLHFRHSGGNACGKYSKAQLNRPFNLLPEKSGNAKWWRTLALIPLTFFGKQLKAQYFEVIHNANTPDTSQLAKQPVLQADSSLIDSTSLSDVVVPAADSILHLATMPPDSSRLQYVWLPSSHPVIITTICIDTWLTDWLGNGIAVYIREPDYKTPNIISDTLRKILIGWKKYSPQLPGIDTLQNTETEKHLSAQNPYHDLSEKPKEEPKPQQPALPASTDLLAILPKDERKYKRT